MGLGTLTPAPTFDLAICRASQILQLRQKFMRLLPASRSAEARRQQIRLALHSVEEFLTPPANRLEHDLRVGIGLILQRDESVDVMATYVDKELFDKQGRALANAECGVRSAESVDIVEAGIGIGVLDRLTPLVAQVLHHFSPSY